MRVPGGNCIFSVLLLAWAGCDASDPGIRPQVTIQDIIAGEGTLAEGNKTVTVDYTGMLASTGEVFDTSSEREPLSFHLSNGLVSGDPQGRSVIDGFVQGVHGMRVGGLRRITVPPQLAWGSRGAGCNDPNDANACTIPPNSTLIFDIELLAVQNPQP